MTEGFKQYVEKENEIVAELKRKLTEENFQKEEPKKQKEESDINTVEEKELNYQRMQLAEKLLEKYPNELFLQKYIDYLTKEAESMDGFTVRHLRLVGPNGVISSGHLAEEYFLDKVNIKASERVLSLRSKTNEAKKKVFSDLVKYYEHPAFQKDEECQLSRVIKKILFKAFAKKGVEIKDIFFYSGVGTTLDFNFGVDGWLKVIDGDGKEIKIFFDLKTGAYKKERPSAFANLLLKVDENGGKVVNNLETFSGLKGFLNQVPDIYLSKKSNIN